MFLSRKTNEEIKTVCKYYNPLKRIGRKLVVFQKEALRRMREHFAKSGVFEYEEQLPSLLQLLMTSEEMTSLCSGMSRQSLKSHLLNKTQKVTLVSGTL